MTIAIRCGTLFDGTEAEPRTNATIVLEGGVVARLAEAGEAVDADRTIEAACVVPGLINAHVHLEANGTPDWQTFFVIGTPTTRLLGAVANARKSLLAGVTTVRDLGADGDTVIELGRAIELGEHQGPTIVAAGRPLCMTGGHGWYAGRETDGPWDARLAVREQRKAGATCIKLIATGGVLTKGAVPGQVQLSEEEMHAAVTEAMTHQLRVTAHAIGNEGIKNALRAGVNSIEHGHLLDDEAIALFRTHNAYLVPTLSAVSRIYENAKSGAQPDFVVQKATAIYEKFAANITRAWEAGVRIAGGSDAGTPYNYHEEYAYEVELMSTLLGMTPHQALHAATGVAGELLDVGRGILAPGKPADLLVLERDLAQDVRALRDPRIVIKDGAIVRES